MPVTTGNFPKAMLSGNKKKLAAGLDKKLDKAMSPAQLKADIKADKKLLAQKKKGK